MVSVWTDERVDLLTQLWVDGLASGVIARRLGLTRGQVVGKRFALGLPARELTAQKAAQAANGRRSAMIRVGGLKASSLALHRPPPPAEPDPPALTGTAPRSWEERRAGECAFPVSPPGRRTVGLFSCCAPVPEGHRWCAGHEPVAMYEPPPRVGVRA